MKPDARTALRILQDADAFGGDEHPARYIEGIAATRFANGRYEISASCCNQIRGRTPLLMMHCFTDPIGLVEELRLTPAGLWFRARFVASRSLPYWTELTWQQVRDGSRFDGVSVGVKFKNRYFQNCAVDEISLAPKGCQMDPRASVHRVWEVYSEDLVPLVGSQEVIYRDTRSQFNLTPSIRLDDRYREEEVRYVRDGARLPASVDRRLEAAHQDVALCCAEKAETVGAKECK